MATLNTAQHFGLEREIGSITPGRLADFLIVSDLAALKIDDVYARGVHLASHGKLAREIEPYDYPASAKNTVHLGKQLAATDFDIHAPEGANRVTARVIGVVENQAPTKALTADLAVTNGLVESDPANDICQIALVERHRGTGAVVNAFVSGFRYTKPCAMASTVAHDSHHMIVVGTNKTDMALAANRLGEVGGGVVLFCEGRELALVEMPVAGLMSDERAEVVAAKAEKLIAAMRDMGCDLNNAYMQHSLLALVVIPELRISDIGLVDVTRFEKVGLFV
jgi:adenine deaminase